MCCSFCVSDNQAPSRAEPLLQAYWEPPCGMIAVVAERTTSPSPKSASGRDSLTVSWIGGGFPGRENPGSARGARWLVVGQHVVLVISPM